MSSLHKPEKLLYDIFQSAQLILDFTDKLSKEEFQNDNLVVSACERKFEIIGEALNRLRKSFPEIATCFPDLDKIIGFRNIIAHGYDIVSSNILWQTIQNDIPKLIKIVQSKIDIDK